MEQPETLNAGSLDALVGEPCRTYQDLIDKTHPMEEGAGESELAADMLAMKLVGERHSKRDLVDLVRWLILRKPDGLTQAR